MKQSEWSRFMYGDTEYGNHSTTAINSPPKIEFRRYAPLPIIEDTATYDLSPYSKADDPFVPRIFKIDRPPVDIRINLDEWDAGLFNKVRHDLAEARKKKFKGDIMNRKEENKVSYMPYKKPSTPIPKRVIFSGPCTIILWEDGTKTVVHCSYNDKFDDETGIAMCYLKKLLGNEGNYYNHIKKAKKMAVNGAKNIEEE